MRLRKEGIFLDDASIIDLYWERSEEAITATDEKYKGLCLHIAGNILSDRCDAEECLNDTYLAMWNKIPESRPKYLPAFIGRIIRNISLKRCEYNNARKRNPEVMLSLDELDECIPSSIDVESSCDAAELGRIITEFLKSQSKRSRVVFVRRYWYYDSVKEISKKLDIPENTVKQLLFRTRKQLKEYLRKEGL